MEKLYKNKYALGVYGKDDELIIMAFSVRELSEAIEEKLSVVRVIVNKILNTENLEGEIIINHKKYLLSLIDVSED